MKKIAILTSFMLLPLVASAGSQFPCYSDTSQMIMNNAQSNMQSRQSQLQYYNNNISNNIDPASGIYSSIASCVDFTANLGFSFPTVSTFMAAVQSAIQSQCQKARSQIIAKTGAMNNNVYVNAGISGVPSIGASISGMSQTGTLFPTTTNPQPTADGLYNQLKGILGGK